MNRIVVGVDGSSHSLVALHWACREAQLRGDSVEIVSAWRVPVANYEVASQVASQELVEAIQGAAADAVKAATEEVKRLAPELSVTAGVYEGQPACILVECAKGADLLVVGSRGLGIFMALLLRSVSQECSRHSPVPIVIVRSEP
ncbi:MAG: universal stress protein [Candidatus Dormibacteria bacterium]